MKKFLVVLGLIFAGIVVFSWGAFPSAAQSALSSPNVYLTGNVLYWSYAKLASTEFEVERSQNGGLSWVHLQSYRAENASYHFIDYSQLCESNYQYRVRVHRLSDNVYSAYSNIETIDTEPCASPLSDEICTFSPFLSIDNKRIDSMLLSGDGSRAFISSWANEQRTLEIYDISTATLIQTLTGITPLGVSDDGSRFIYLESDLINDTDELKIWTNGSSETIAEMSWIESPSISGDGGRIAFIGVGDYVHGLFLWEEGLGYNVVDIGPEWPNLARISGDGNSIAIHSYHNGNYPESVSRWDAINGLVPLGDKPEPQISIISEIYELRGLSISHDGSAISMSYFYNNDMYPEYNILYTWRENEGFASVYDYDGEDFDNTERYEWIPSAWSGDGNRILFLSDDNITGENPDESQEYFFRDGGSVHQITTNASYGYFLSNVTMSDDGTKILAITASPVPLDTASHALSEFQIMLGTCDAPSGYTPLSAVSNLSTVTNGQEQVDLSWIDTNVDESGYLVEAFLGYSWYQVDELPANTITYSFWSGDCGRDYQFRVRAYRDDGIYSPFSEIVIGSTDDCETMLAPTNLSLRNLAEGSIQVSWTDMARDETRYIIERAAVTGGSSTSSTGGASSSTGSTASGTGTSSTGTSSTATGGTSTSSTGTTGSSTTALLALERGGGTSGMEVQWGSDSAGAWYVVGEVGANETSFVDSVRCGTQYLYRVRAYRESDNSYSAYSSSYSQTSIPCGYFAPSNLRSVDSSASSISLEWVDNGSNETRYHIERASNNSWAQIAILDVNSTSFIDTGLLCETEYRYRVRAYRSIDNVYSSYTTLEDAPTAACSEQGAPGNLLVSATDATTISLSWTDNAVDETGFVIERATTNSLFWTPLVTLAANTTTYPDSSGLGCTYGYLYRVRALRAGNQSTSSNVVTGYLQCPAPNAPSNMLLIGQSSSSIEIRWTRNGIYSAVFIERSTDGGANWTELARLSSSAESYTDRELNCESSYQYRVRHYREFDNSYSAYSPVLSASTLVCPSFNAPSNLMMNSNSEDSITVGWQDTNSDETGFTLEMSENGINWSTIATVAADSTSYTIDDLNCAREYFFRIRAIKGSRNSNYSSVLLAEAGDCPALIAPLSINISAVHSYDIVTEWVDDNSNATGFRVERSLDGANWEEIAQPQYSEYQNAGLDCDATYYYRVRAYRSYDDSYSAYSSVVSGTTTSCLMNAALQLSFTGATASSVSLSWLDTANDETSFFIERGIGGYAWTVVGEVDANSTSFTHSNMICDIYYSYRIRAYRESDGSYSAYSSPLMISCPNPSAPINLTATASTIENSITLSYTDTSNSETGFRVERHSGDGNWVWVATGSANSSSVKIQFVSCETTYYFRIRTYRSTDEKFSDYSSEVSATVRPCLIRTPTGLTITGSTSNSLSLVWVDTNTNETGYRLERSPNGTSWTQIASLVVDASAYEDTGLSCGLYFYRVRAYRTSDSAISSYSNTTFGVAPCPVLSTPVLSASASGMSVELSWVDTNTTESGFRLEESSNGGTSWTEFAQPAANASAIPRTMPLCGTRYQYRIRAYRAQDASYSAYSNVVEVQSLACPPLAPTSLAILETSTGNISLSWTDNATDETAYHIERSTNFGTSYNEITQVDAGSTGYNDTGHVCNQYRYRVRAYRAGDNRYSDYSNIVYLTCPAPAAPTNLIQTESSSTSITISWTDNAADETHHRVERSTNGVSWTLWASVSTPDTTYTNAGLSCNTSYMYRVRAYRSTDTMNSGYSNVLTASTLACPPTAPSSLSITDNSGGNVTLNWLDNASNEAGYRLERSTNSGSSWTEIAQLEASTTSYSDTGVLCFQYRYRVRAAGSAAGVYSSYSNLAYLTCPAPVAPSNLRTTSVFAFSVALAWDDNSSDESFFAIQQSSNGGTSWSTLNSVPTNSTSVTHYNTSCNSNYMYRVRAYRSMDSTYSAWSSAISATTGPCLVAPTTLTSTGQTSTSISLSWAETNVDETSYLVERSTNGTSFSTITVLSANTTSYVDSGRSCNTTYWYRVRGYRMADNLYSSYSNSFSVSTAACVTLLVPTSIGYTNSSTTSLSLSWVDNSTNESAYEVERSMNGTNWQIVASLPANSTSYSDNGLDCQTAYRYRIRSLHLGNGTYSGYGTSTFLQTQTCPPLVTSSLSSTGSTVSSITISWTVDSTATSYTLSYSQGAAWFSLGTFARSVNNFSHSALACGRSYQYRVQAYRQQDNALLYSNSFVASTSACPALAIPAAATVLNADVALVSLRIPAMPSSATSMNLERSTDGVNWFGLGIASGNYLDASVVCGTSYQYRLVAFRASDGQYSMPSPVAHATTLVCPVAVSNVVGIYRGGQWLFVDSNDTGNPASSFNFGDGQWQPVVGDWDGDGVDGLGLYRNGQFILRNNAGGTISETRFSLGDGTAGWQAVVGDWNGDGIDSIGVYRDGTFLLSDDNTNPNYRFNFGDGASGWQAVAGDWVGNGADGIGLYKNGVWYLAGSALNPVGTMQTIAYGPNQAGWLPVVGDWNGDGMDTIGLYKDGLWRLRLSSNSGGNEISLFFGQAGDVPVAIYEGDAEGLAAFGMPVESPELPPVIASTATNPPVIEPSPEPSAVPATVEPEITPEVTETP